MRSTSSSPTWISNGGIADLKDEDLYTYVTLAGTEFLSKQGCYANVFESCVQRSRLNAFDQPSRRTDGWASLLKDADNRITTATSLLGGISILFGDAKGGIQQWFMVRGNEGSPSFQKVRSFQLDNAPVLQILPEERRKGFIALDAESQNDLNDQLQAMKAYQFLLQKRINRF